MRTLSCIEAEEQLPALALGALSIDEQAEVTAHLDGCLGCREQYNDYTAVGTALLYAVPQRVPPAALKENLMARVRPQSSGWTEKVSVWLKSTILLPRWGLAFAICVILALSVLAVTQFTRLSAEQANLVNEIKQRQGALAMLASSNTLSIGMTGTDAAKGASATLLYEPQQATAVLIVHNLPALPAAQSYQLWLIDSSGRRDSGAVFNIQAGTIDESIYIVSVPRPFYSYVRCGVSIEPQGGSPKPTGPAVLTGSYS